MTLKSLACDDRKVAPNELRRIPARCDKIDALEKSAVAELSFAVINAMTCDELVRMIRVANLPALFRPDLDRHLPHQGSCCSSINH
jgi:hypothetical protein